MPYCIEDYLKPLPIISILRGIKTEEIEAIADTLVRHGNRCIEVPLNSPTPYKSIEILVRSFGDQALCGAGTVTSVDQVQRVFDAGGKIVISPNCDVDVIRKTVELNMLSVPGIATASEAFTAINAGADALKLFPASSIGIDFLRALRTVLPPKTPIVATGGINPNNLTQWLSNGASGAGIGSDIYQPGFDTTTVAKKMEQLAAAISVD